MNKQNKKVKKVKITLADLYETIHKSFTSLENKISQEVGVLRREMNTKFNDVITTQDNLLKEVGDLKDEKTMDVNFRDRFDKLEQDVEKIKIRLGLSKN